jgi:hypothetical protein
MPNAPINKYRSPYHQSCGVRPECVGPSARQRSLIVPHVLSRDNPEFRASLDDLARADRLVLLIGAGASYDSGLPGWNGLVTRLLQHALMREGVAQDLAQKEADRLVEAKGPMPGASLARAILGNDRDEVLRGILYDAQGTEPGPIAQALADLIASFEGGIFIITTNYDENVETTLRATFGDDAVRSVVPAGEFMASTFGSYVVNHLHGFIPRMGQILAPVILDERDFAMMDQDTLVQLAELLVDPAALFVGMSLTDPNVVNPTYRAAATRTGVKHYGLFVGEFRPETPNAVRELIARRLERQCIRPVNLASYGQVSQFLVELALRLEYGDDYWSDDALIRYGHRLVQWRQEAEGRWPRSGDHFGEAQNRLHEELRGAVAAIESHLGTRRKADEHLGAHLWARRPDAHSLGYLELWAASAQLHRDPWSLSHPPASAIAERSENITARAVFFGSPQARDVSDVRSRWQHMLALPVILREEPWYGLCVGGITLASTKSGAESALRAALTRPEHRAVLGELQQTAVRLLGGAL